MFDQDNQPKDHNQILSQLAGVLAHEIRNPLTGISTTVQLLREKLQNEQVGYSNYCDVILEELERINRIITDLVDFARPSQFETMQVDMHEVLDRVLLLVEAETEKRAIRIEKEYQDGGAFVVVCEPNRTRQALLNLLINAFEAVDKNGTVRIMTRSVEKDGLSLQSISIQDSGHGIDRDSQEKLFLPFFSTKTRGMGLGLAITKKIIQQHGGTIQVESEPGKGTIFTMLFPHNT